MEKSAVLHMEIKSNNTNDGFIGVIREKGFPIIVNGKTETEVKEKMPIALRAFCILANCQNASSMLQKGIYDEEELIKKAYNYKLEKAVA